MVAASVRKKLRNNMPSPERMLWAKLKSKQIASLKFRRQHGIGPYIVDFYCPEKSIVIEVDGDTHWEPNQQDRDSKRDAYLHSIGLKVIRYTNREVVHNLEGVLQDLIRQIASTSPSPPYKGGE